jgi:hypothetical protein
MVNALFEFMGGLFVLGHCKVAIKDRQVKGVSVPSAAFFLGWGVWNLFYYPGLSQWYSFGGGVFLTAANVLYVSLLIKYRGR